MINSHTFVLFSLFHVLFFPTFFFAAAECQARDAHEISLSHAATIALCHEALFFCHENEEKREKVIHIFEEAST